MNRLLLSLFFVLFASLIMAQVETGEYSIADVEAHGLIGSTSPIIKTESILDSTTWTSTTSAPNSFGKYFFMRSMICKKTLKDKHNLVKTSAKSSKYPNFSK